MRKNPHFGILAAVTYGLVALTALLAVAAYFYFRSSIRPGEQADPNPQRRMMVGAVWVPVYPNATYFDPEQQQEKAVTTGAVKFRTPDDAATVIAFHEDALRKGSLVTRDGNTVRAVRSGGRETVLVTVERTAENTTGEIHTLSHAPEPRPKN